jgi:TonB family protein
MNQITYFLLLISLAAGSAAALAADDQKAEKPKTDIATKTKDGEGNIAPYRKDLLMRIAAVWHPTKKEKNAMTVELTVSKDGKLLKAEITKSSGDKEADRLAIEQIKTAKLAPLPSWYREKKIIFKIDLEKTEAKK